MATKLYFTDKYLKISQKHKGISEKNFNIITAQQIDRPDVESPEYLTLWQDEEPTESILFEDLMPDVEEEVFIPEAPETVPMDAQVVQPAYVRDFLRDAINHRMPVTFDYFSLMGNFTVGRLALPEDIQRINFRDLVLTWDMKKTDYRLFVIDGMTNVKLAV